MTNIDEYWKKFIAETGRSEEDRCAGDLSFEAKGFVGDELITLVLTNRKTAFFTSWATYTWKFTASFPLDRLDFDLAN